MASHNDLGKKGELLAQDYLKQKGFSIIASNWREARWEIDIIARKGKLLLFAEVKSRSSSFFGEPELAVHPRKESFLQSAVEAYLEDHPFDGEIRFDVIAITFGKDGTHELFHLEDVF